LDPIYYQVNQTKLTEVTQKSSDNLRLQSNKEARRKSQTNEVDKSAMSTDTSSMSDDMLGNMDPDDYGGSGARQFAQMWKEQLAEERKDKEEEQEPEQEGDSGQHEEPQDEHGPNKEEVEVAKIDEAEPEVAQNLLERPADASASVAVAGETARPAEPAQGREGQEAAEAPGRQSQTSRSSPTGQREAASPESVRAEVEAASSERFQTEPKSAGPGGQLESRKPQPRGSLGSLLDHSSGFLIAEEAAWEGTAEHEESVVEETPEEVVPEEISILLERLVTGDSAQPGFRKLHQLLSRFGRKVLQMCLEAQARVYLLPPGEPLLAHPQLAQCGYTDLEGAAYLPEHRLCLVEDRCVTTAPHGFHPVFYYFAHLYDHALGGENFASLKSAAVRASYQACLDGSHRFGDLMAAHSPAHYFAQAVESYLAENDCYEPLWTRQDLYDFDRSIYDYIEYLLK